MKKLLNLFVALVLAGFLGYWAYLLYFQQNNVTARDVYFEIQQPKTSLSQPLPEPKQGKIDITCYVWGPFKESGIKRATEKLRKAGLSEQATMHDRFLPEKYIAYLGPFDNKEAALAFQKQFRKQGYQKARAILQGGLSFGVEIETFSSEEEARKFMAGPRTPRVKGVRITNRLGEPSGEVEFVLPGIDEQERVKLVDLWHQTPGSELKNCTY